MEKTLKIINSLVEKGIIINYAIGGSMAANYYGESELTYNLDVFVSLSASKKDYQPLEKIYLYLTWLGCESYGVGIVIEGVFVQFLPPYNNLVEEAINNSVPITYCGTEFQILSHEYLIAIGENESVEITYKEEMERIIKSKHDHRVELSKLPLPEKVNIVVKLQRIKAELDKAAGRKPGRVWRI
jgi:hypothetical protein